MVFPSISIGGGNSTTPSFEALTTTSPFFQADHVPSSLHSHHPDAPAQTDPFLHRSASPGLAALFRPYVVLPDTPGISWGLTPRGVYDRVSRIFG